MSRARRVKELPGARDLIAHRYRSEAVVAPAGREATAELEADDF
jgi:hypothetical protein